jgi:hypothetical protein
MSIKSNKERSLMFFAISVGALAMVAGMEWYWQSYHNLDTGQNMRYVEQEFDTTLVDITLQGDILTSEEAYLMGARNLRWALYTSMLGSVLFGVGISRL